MEISVTERFLRDHEALKKTLKKKCLELMCELREIEPAALRKNSLPGWRLHKLKNSNMVSLSVDMNYRVLAQLKSSALLLHRVVKHKLADRPRVNQNDQRKPLARITADEFHPADVYSALLSFGVADVEAEYFRACSTEDDLLNAASDVSEPTANLALNLYETSQIVIPQARFRVLHKDQDFASILEAGGVEWEMYLHPSQSYIVDLPPRFRTAVVGSAGTGKTVCAWYRTKNLIELGVSVGFVCPHKSVLNVSKEHLLKMSGPKAEESFFFVPNGPAELIQLAEAVGHIIIDEAQEIPVTWLVRLAEEMCDSVGLTLFYDINQLGGNIPKGDVRRYRYRISEWKAMLSKFPRIHKCRLTINYRNAREISEYYLDLLEEALPAKPFAEVPLFESGDVIQHRIMVNEINDVLASLLRRLLEEYLSKEIGVVVLYYDPRVLFRALVARNLPVSVDASQDAVVVTNASRIRGNERQVIIVVARESQSLRQKIGVAIHAYIAMSRAIKRLFVIEAVQR